MTFVNVNPIDSQSTHVDHTAAQMMFYFDTDDPSIVDQFAPHIKRFGGDCTPFFSKYVTHLITNKISSKKGEITVTTLSNRGGTRGYSVTIPPSANVSLLCPSSLATVPTTTTTCGSSVLDRFGASPVSPSSSALCALAPSTTTPTTGSTFPHQYHRHSNAFRHVPSSASVITSVNGKENNIMSVEERETTATTRPSIPLKTLASTPQGVPSCDPSSMLQLSREQQKCDLIHKAKIMNTTIWTLDQLLSYLKRSYENVSESVEHIPLFSGLCRTATRKKETDLMNCLLAEKQQYQQQRSINAVSMTTPHHNSIAADSLAIRHSSRLSCNSASKNILTPGPSTSNLIQQSQFIQFEHPFILIEDINGSYRPFFKEFKPTRTAKPPVLPCIYLNSPPGHCPFIKPSSSTINKKQKCDGAKTERDHRTHKQTRHPLDSHIVSKWRSEIHTKCSKIKRPGYCECCLEKYSDLTEHSRQSQHRRFAIHKDNFAQLDIVISDLRRPMKVQSMEVMMSSCPGTPRSSSPFANPATCHDSLLSASCKRKERPLRSNSAKRKLPDHMFVRAIECEPESDGFGCSNNNSSQYHNTPSSPLCQKYANTRVEKLEVI